MLTQMEVLDSEARGLSTESDAFVTDHRVQLWIWWWLLRRHILISLVIKASVNPIETWVCLKLKKKKLMELSENFHLRFKLFYDDSDPDNETLLSFTQKNTEINKPR